MKKLLALLLLTPSLSWGNDDLSGKNLICGLDDNKSILVIQFKEERLATVFASLNFNSDSWNLHDNIHEYKTSLTEITILSSDRPIVINRQTLDTTYYKKKSDRTFMNGYCKIAKYERSINAIESHKNDWNDFMIKKTQSLKEQQKI